MKGRWPNKDPLGTPYFTQRDLWSVYVWLNDPFKSQTGLHVECHWQWRTWWVVCIWFCRIFFQRFAKLTQASFVNWCDLTDFEYRREWPLTHATVVEYSWQWRYQMGWLFNIRLFYFWMEKQVTSLKTWCSTDNLIVHVRVKLPNSAYTLKHF